MSNLSDYTTGLDDSVWTDARASELDTAMSTSTWTSARAGYLDALAGGSLGFKPVQHYVYVGTGSGNITVSIADYQQCMVSGSSSVGGSNSWAGAYRTTSNTNVAQIGGPSTTVHAFTVTRFG